LLTFLDAATDEQVFILLMLQSVLSWNSAAGRGVPGRRAERPMLRRRSDWTDSGQLRAPRCRHLPAPRRSRRRMYPRCVEVCLRQVRSTPGL